MAGATKPTISSGITKPKNDENTPLKVTKIRASQSGNTNPAPTPAAMAITILSNNGIDISFFQLIKFDFIP
jgi:hypothetical protein